MRSSLDPAAHQAVERRMVEHVMRVLDDDRLRIDTIRGRRPAKTFLRHVARTDRAHDVKRLLSDAGRPDRELQSAMPTGVTVDLTLAARKWFLFKERVGRMKVVCVSPTRALVEGTVPPDPLRNADVDRLLAAEVGSDTVPVTVVVCSTSGFTREAHEAADRRAGRTVILVEPTDSGGFKVSGPSEIKPLLDLLDPEAESEKRDRIRSTIEQQASELTGSGVAADRIAHATDLPVQLIEAELKAYAKDNPGLVAKRLEGRVVLYRESAAPPAAEKGSPTMPLKDMFLQLFARKGETEKKIAYLSERRAMLGQTRDRTYDELTTLEHREVDLKKEFTSATTESTKRRITSQLVQLRRELTRKQQLVDVLNRQVEVVGTHQHALELVKQGNPSNMKLAAPEEMAKDAAAAEEVLAQLQADSELADSLMAMTGTSSMTAEEQALYEELEKEAGRGKAEPAQPARAAGSTQTASPAQPAARPRESTGPRRSEPEAT